MTHLETIRAAKRGLVGVQLALEHQDLAYTLAYFLLGDEGAATSAIQTAFLRTFQEMGRFRHGSFRGWLIQRVLEACRGQPVRFESLPAGSQGDLTRKLFSLPVDYRSVAIMVDLLGMDYEEAAQAAGCSPKAVSHRLARARSAIANGE
jgi:RNA polymerase sigma-70 factor (ECF subfamily)